MEERIQFEPWQNEAIGSLLVSPTENEVWGIIAKLRGFLISGGIEVN